MNSKAGYWKVGRWEKNEESSMAWGIEKSKYSGKDWECQSTHSSLWEMITKIFLNPEKNMDYRFEKTQRSEVILNSSNSTPNIIIREEINNKVLPNFPTA